MSNGKTDMYKTTNYNLYHFIEEDYIEIETKLFSPATPAPELQSICMTLAHLNTERAQHLLEMFRESDRAFEVRWLDFEAGTNSHSYLEPRDENEERDYMALKVMQELHDEILKLGKRL